MSLYYASAYDNSSLGSLSYGSSNLYSRNASVPLGATIDDAIDLGDLIVNQTQLDASSSLSQLNGEQFYKFDLTGSNLKLALAKTSEDIEARVQVFNSSGAVVADSATSATQALQDAYTNVTSSDGLSLDSGEHFVRVTYGETTSRVASLSYNLALYSGDSFNTSYKTVAKPQTAASQVLLTDQTMTFSTIDAQSYGTEATHSANEEIDDAISIGWISADKSALAVTSQLTDVCDEQFYSFILQKGENLKFAISNHTDTKDIRVQVYDAYGTNVLADSHGTDRQKEAYASLNTAEGLEATSGQYNIKISYAEAGTKSDQVYDFNVFSGSIYENLYETTVATVSRSDALYLGQLVPDFSAKAALATYLTSSSQGEESNIMDFIS